METKDKYTPISGPHLYLMGSEEPVKALVCKRKDTVISY
jgi:hypothetical protein